MVVGRSADGECGQEDSPRARRRRRSINSCYGGKWRCAFIADDAAEIRKRAGEASPDAFTSRQPGQPGWKNGPAGVRLKSPAFRRRLNSGRP